MGGAHDVVYVMLQSFQVHEPVGVTGSARQMERRIHQIGSDPIRKI
jgi:hypothetical protein